MTYTLIWMDGRETDHHPASLGLDPETPPAEIIAFRSTTRARLLRWRVDQATYQVVEYNHRGVSA